jgi:hypothetical protein
VDDVTIAATPASPAEVPQFLSVMLQAQPPGGHPPPAAERRGNGAGGAPRAAPPAPPTPAAVREHPCLPVMAALVDTGYQVRPSLLQALHYGHAAARWVSLV